MSAFFAELTVHFRSHELLYGRRPRIRSDSLTGITLLLNVQSETLIVLIVILREKKPRRSLSREYADNRRRI